MFSRHLSNLISICGHNHSAEIVWQSCKLGTLVASRTDALLPAKGRRRGTDETDTRAPSISEVFWQEYQSRDRVKEREESERAERRKERKGERKAGKGANAQKGCRGRSVDVTASGPPLDSFIHHVHSSNGHCARVWCTFLSLRMRDAHEVVIFARPQIVNEDINLVCASTCKFIALNVSLFLQLRLSR